MRGAAEPWQPYLSYASVRLYSVHSTLVRDAGRECGAGDARGRNEAHLMVVLDPAPRLSDGGLVAPSYATRYRAQHVLRRANARGQERAAERGVIVSGS